MTDVDLLFKCPFTSMIADPTSSGKTVLVRRIIKNYKTLFYFKEPVETLRIIWAYGQWQSLYLEPIGNNVDVEYISGLHSEAELREKSPYIIVIDDLMNELGNNKKLADLFTKGSHHMNLSIIFIAQNLFHQGKQMRNINLNCHYYLLTKNPRDKA